LFPAFLDYSPGTQNALHLSWEAHLVAAARSVRKAVPLNTFQFSLDPQYRTKLNKRHSLLKFSLL
jgi:hypothetical protein